VSKDSGCFTQSVDDEGLVHWSEPATLDFCW